MDVSLQALKLVASVLEVSFSIEEVSKRYFSDEMHDEKTQLVRAAKSIGLKAKSKFFKNKLQFIKVPSPFIFYTKSGDIRVFLSKSEDYRCLIQDPSASCPEIIPFDDLVPQIRGDVVMFTRRHALLSEENKFTMKWFLTAFSRYKKLLFEIVLASFFIQLLALVTPIFFQVVVDKVLTHHSLTTLDVLAIGMLAVVTFDVLLSWLRNYQLSHTAQRLDVSLGARLYQHLMGLPMAYFLCRQVGTTVARVHELKNIREFLTGSTLTLCIDLFFTLIFFIVMYLYSPVLTYIVLGSLVPYILLSLIITPVLRRRLDIQFKRGAENQAFLVESISGIETIKSQAIEGQMERRWDEQLAGFVTSSFRTQMLGNGAQQVSQWISKVTMLLLLWVGARLVITGQLTVGELIAFNMFAGQVNAPILRIVQLWHQFQQVRLSVKRLGDILNVPTEVNKKKTYTNIKRIRGEVSFEKVRFSYSPDAPPTINDLDLHIKPGEIIGVVGRSGSGKSTLAKLLQSFYHIQSGQIKVDGVSINSISPSALRHQIGVVQQETNLFNRSIRDNIALAHPGASNEDILEVAKLSGVHDFIGDLQDGYNTIVGEHGCLLSGGQRQRVGIARALLGDPRILIFDEATSALDYESEAIIQQNMQAICQNRTVIIIAHRLSTVRCSDRVIVVDHGRVVEQGHWEMLLRRKGHYSRLHDLQEGRTA
ncbi:type I secretion system permease/ATPase [Veronia pacifica]|uniref:Peptidase C39 n=1 Tax=Veronia pacifica TaxID=1080227 RepID=A0A1C3EG67_9GAMM|nr:type I secretion system permease/ATPase [Veronia pacifica]ODA32220.1 peptidase C39 [Veronia pacifica]